MMSEEDMAALEEAQGTEAAQLYLEQMITHHEGAVDMAREQLDSGQNPQALQLSQPLHFGDYGGLPLKLLWAALALFTIVVLGSGLYLWLGRRHAPFSLRLAEVTSGGRIEPAVSPAE